MSSYEVHKRKYLMFLKDAENESVSHPARIEVLFEATFHLIESVAAKHAIHINKYQLVRSMLEEHKEIFDGHTEQVWRAFQEMENQIRPGQSYGGAINGEALKRMRTLFSEIKEICKAGGNDV